MSNKTNEQISDHPHEFQSDDGICLTCGKTVVELMAEQPQPRKKIKTGGTMRRVCSVCKTEFLGTGMDNLCSKHQPQPQRSDWREAADLNATNEPGSLVKMPASGAASGSEQPTWACSKWGGYEHDWMECPECLEAYSKLNESGSEPLKEEQEFWEKINNDIGNDSVSLSDEDWIKELRSESHYSHIRVRDEYGKMKRWCEVNKREPTRRRLINWLNRIERPLQLGERRPKTELIKVQPDGWLAWLQSNYPDAKSKDYWKAPGDVQREFNELEGQPI